jgi:hypothetical protein
MGMVARFKFDSSGDRGGSQVSEARPGMPGTRLSSVRNYFEYALTQVMVGSIL